MLRLRQICLVAPELESAVECIERIFAVAPCHRDTGVAKYGLVNALFVFGHQFLEIVAPTSGIADDTTAAGRYLQRSKGRGGYMAIFDCDDPERRQAHVTALGLRIAHVLDYPGKFWGIQLHPLDARATMLEFDRTVGNEELAGNYWPAGPDWLAAQRLDLVQGIALIDIESETPAGIAQHWSRIIESPLDLSKPDPEMRFDLGAVRFLRGETPGRELMSRVHVSVTDPRGVLARASACGLPARGTGFDFCGVTIVPVDGRP